MAEFNNFLATGKKYVANMQYCARYRTNFRDLPGSKESYLFHSPPPLPIFRICNNIKCKTCPQASKLQIASDPLLSPFCKTFNVIYKITCNVCNLQYVGETSTPINKRINQHRSDSCNLKKNTIELKHFNFHKFENTTIEIVKIQPQKTKRLYLESCFMKYYNSIYPYGLNSECFNKIVKVYSNINDNSNYSPIYPTLNHSLYKKTTRNKRGKYNSEENKVTKTYINKALTQLHKSYKKEFNWRVVRKFVFDIKKHNLPLFLKEFKNRSFHINFSDVFYDLIMSKIIKLNINLIEKPKSTLSTSNFMITFTNPIYNKINLSSILNDKNCLFPLKNLHISRTFKYPVPLGRKVFNYNSFSKNLSASNLVCNCNDPSLKKFVDSNHGHIITGNIDIVNDPKLKKFMSYGTKFRLPSKYTFSQIIKQFTHDINYYIYKLAINYNKPIEFFDQWKTLIIIQLSNHLKQHESNLYFVNNNLLNNSIKILQNNFIISYVDKSSNNYAFICKSYYHQLLTSLISSNNSFKLLDTTTIIINRSINSYYKLLNLTPTNFNYPYIVLIPKFHKSPIKFRTVTIGCNSYNNHANRTLLNILKNIHELTIKNDNKFSLKNSFQLVTSLKKIKNVKNILTYDFKDLFNNIHLSDLSDIINSLFNQYKNHLNLPDYINDNYFKTLTNFILFKNYILHDNKIYQQVEGIPQGGSTSSYLADLYLYYYERSLNADNFLYYRYIDDIIIIFIGDVNSYDFPISFPPSLELTKNNLINNSISFLDLNIKILNSNLIFEIYDKRSDFKFNVNTFTNFKSCLHISVYRNIILNHVHRIKYLCSPSLISKNINNLLLSAINHGFPQPFIHSLISK